MRKYLWPPSAVIVIQICGCRRAPAFNILGSYFPGWILCILVGIVATVAVRLVLYYLRLEQHISLLPMMYVSMAIFFACVLWLVVFE